MNLYIIRLSEFTKYYKIHMLLLNGINFKRKISTEEYLQAGINITSKQNFETAKLFIIKHDLI